MTNDPQPGTAKALEAIRILESGRFFAAPLVGVLDGVVLDCVREREFTAGAAECPGLPGSTGTPCSCARPRARD